MSKTAFAFAVSFLAAVVFISSRSEPLAAENAKIPAQKWEYKIYRTDELNMIRDHDLNELGEMGWEAVGIAMRATAMDGEKSAVLLKRQK